jgi:hypothetical protein
MNDLTPVVPEHKIKTISVPYYSPVPLRTKSNSHLMLKSLKTEYGPNDTLVIADMPDSILIQDEDTILGSDKIMFYPKDSLIAYYPFKDSTKDESSNGLDGIVIKEDISSNPEIYVFNSQEDSTFIKIPDSNGKLKLRHSFTIAVWYRNDTLLDIPQGIIGKTRICGKGSTFGLQLGQRYYNENGADQNIPTLIFGINDGNDPNAKKATVIYQNTAILDGNWHFVVCTFEILDSEKVKLKIYFDGKDPQNYDPQNFCLPEDSNQPIYIGRDSKFPCDGTTGERYFLGGIDNLMIYNKVLSNDEIIKLRDLRIKN